MLFFQALLLAGYAYAHLRQVFAPQAEPLIHSVLLVAALATLPLRRARCGLPAARTRSSGSCSSSAQPSGFRRPACGEQPAAARGPRAPVRARTRTACSPCRTSDRWWRCSATFVVEPNLGGAAKCVVLLFAAFAVLCVAVAWGTPPKPPEEERAALAPLAAGDIVLWLALSATGSVLLLAVTNHLTQNVASVPLLLAPLTLYLASFILTFDGKGWYRPEWLWSVLLVWIAAMGWLIVDDDFQFDLPVQLGIFLPGLFLGAFSATASSTGCGRRRNG